MYVYAVFFEQNGHEHVAVGTRKPEAVQFARAHRGRVGRISRQLYRDGGLYGWDAPTFKAQADFVADYRGGGR